MIYHIILLAYLFIVGIFDFKHYETEDDRRKSKIILMCIGLFVFGALRGISVGTDIPSYVSEYKRYISLGSLEDAFSYQYRDSGYVVFCWLLGKISADPQILLATVSLIVAIGFGIFVYCTKANPFLVFIFFITFRIFSFTLSGLRQAIAMSLIWIAYYCLEKKRYIWFCCLLLVASTFHVSSLIFIMIILLRKIKKPAVIAIPACIIFAEELLSGFYITSVVNKLLFMGRFSNYINTALVSARDFSLTLVLYITFFVASFYVLYIINKDRSEIIVRMINYSVIGIFFAALGPSFPNMFRISYYFVLFLFPLFGMFIERISGNKFSEILFIIIICTVLSIQYLLLGTSAGTEQYVLFWNA